VAEAMHEALVQGDMALVRELTYAQEMGVWRLGRLLAGEEVEPGEEASSAWEDPQQAEAALREEIRSLAQVSQRNAQLLTDGLRTVQALRQVLQGDVFPGEAWVAPPVWFSHKA
jgi:hypothetical protein